MCIYYECFQKSVFVVVQDCKINIHTYIHTHINTGLKHAHSPSRHRRPAARRLQNQQSCDSRCIHTCAHKYIHTYIHTYINKGPKHAHSPSRHRRPAARRLQNQLRGRSDWFLKRIPQGTAVAIRRPHVHGCCCCH